MSKTLFKRTLKVFTLLLSVYLIVSGWTDLDWMIVCYKYQFGQGLMVNRNWVFCPYLTMNWWTAFEFSLARVVIGAILLGVVAKWLWDSCRKDWLEEDDL